MKDNKKIPGAKSFLINVLYHVGFNEQSIKDIASVSSADIKKHIIK
tara:strand:+ start:14660 stop:14797 length:138 start_codon:yes stop_codon:yes gene_type:complete